MTQKARGKHTHANQPDMWEPRDDFDDAWDDGGDYAEDMWDPREDFERASHSFEARSARELTATKKQEKKQERAHAKQAKKQAKELEKEWKKQRKPRLTPLRVILGIIILAVVSAIVAVCVIGHAWLSDLPECGSAEDFNVSQPTKVYASDHETLLASFSLQYRIPLDSIDDVGDYAKYATVAVEDERFYDHNGVDLQGIVRALWNNVTGGEIEGASTITQQLARNTVLSDEATEMSLKRKLREAAVALQMETLFSKDEILLMYMNTVNYGSGAYGIEAAAQRYFSKSAKDLTLSEAALLAGIPQSPTYNNPIDNLEQAELRRNAVLDRMVSNGYITNLQATEAKAEPIELDLTDISTDGIEAYPYFTSYVRDQLLTTYNLTTADIFEGGLTVYTTLDLDYQQYAEDAVDKKLATTGDYAECALTAIDPSNGYIKAMVGGRDFYENQYNMATQAQRQAGSSFKTFTLTAAIEQGIDPQTQVSCSSYVKLSDWEVKNYGSTDYGTRSIASAFAVSSNTGFARLIAATGTENVIDVARRMGITSPLDNVLGLTLGISGVTTLEMADSYATIANGGTHYDPVCVEKAVDRRGNVVIDNTNPTGTRAISKEVAYAVTQCLKGVVTSGTGTAAKLSNGQESGGKTGTTEYDYDKWFCGITPQMSVAIWLGDPSNTKAVSQSSVSVFADFMNAVLEGEKTEEFPKADNPKYTRTFKNTDLDIKEVTSWSYNSRDRDDDEDEDDDDDSGSSSSNSSRNGTSNSSSSGPGSSGRTSNSSGPGGSSSDDEDE